jgi:hypothetical protein
MGGWVLRQHRRRCSVMKHVYSTTRVTIRSHKYLTIHVAESMESLTNNGPVDHKQPAPMTYQTLFQYNDNRGIPTRDAWRGCRTSQHHRTKEQKKANYKMCTRATIVSCLRVQLFNYTSLPLIHLPRNTDVENYCYVHPVVAPSPLSSSPSDGGSIHRNVRDQL